MTYYTGWLVPKEERDRLLRVFPPVYPDLVAHHVTREFGVPLDGPVLQETSGTVVGISIRDGMQALVVSIGGTIRRTDGGTFHVT